MTVLPIDEDVPDGTFGGARLVRGEPSRIHISRPDPAAARHVAELLDGLDGWCLGDRASRPHTPHTRQDVAHAPHAGP